MKKIVSIALAAVLVLSVAVVAFAAPVYRGDISGDGQVTSLDARYALQIAAQLRTCSQSEKAVADMNGDGEVTGFDARIILQVAVGAQELEELPTNPSNPGGSTDIGSETGKDGSIEWDDIIPVP